MWWLVEWLAGAAAAWQAGPPGATIVLALLVAPLAVFVHECGHALPALLLTRGDVDMHVGVEGSGVQVRAGRFRMTLRPWSSQDQDVAGWVEHRVSSVPAAMVITFGGPFFSFLGAVAGGTLAQRFALGSFQGLLFGTFWFVCGFHAIVNLVPKDRPLTDGARLLWLWRYMWDGPPIPEDPNAATSVPPPSAGGAG
jgi:hypothetical protein